MIRSHNTKAGLFSCAGEKFSTLAEAVAFVESHEGAELGEMTVGFRCRKRIRLGKGNLALNLGKRAPRSASAATGSPRASMSGGRPRRPPACLEPGSVRRMLKC